MKKRLYWMLFISFTAFFAFIAMIFRGSFEISIIENINDIFTITVIVIIVNLVLSEILTKLIIKESSKPFERFIIFIKNTFLQNSNDVDSKEKSNIIKDLEVYSIDVEELEKSVDNLLSKQKYRREFSANVSHELKSPLTSIIGYAELISEKMATGEDAAVFASRINTEGKKLLNMIDEIIQISKIDNSSIKKDTITTFDIGEVIKENIESLSMFAKEKNVNIFYDYEKMNYLGSKILITDLVRNMISNAIKYSKDTGGNLTIEVKDIIDKVKLTFIDDGIGIDQNEHEKIFERFYVVNKSRGSKSGTGLGLSLVKNIVKFHQGEILLESKLGEGSKFIITLPKLSEKDF